MSTLFDRTMELLKFMSVCGSPVGVMQLSRELGIPKASVSRMLSMLAGHDYVVKLPSGRFIIGPGTLLPAYTYMREDILVKTCRPYVESLAHLTDQSVFVLAYVGQGRLYLVDDLVISGSLRRRIKPIGETVDMVCTAGGKAILMSLPGAELEELVDGHTFIPHTPSSLQNRDELLGQLDFFRKRGFSEDTGEYVPEICAVAAPVLNKNNYPVGCVSVVSSTFLKHRSEMVRAGQVMADITSQINSKIRSL